MGGVSAAVDVYATYTFKFATVKEMETSENPLTANQCSFGHDLPQKC